MASSLHTVYISPDLLAFLQVNWFTSHLSFCRPGLLGKDKYDFAKTYCDVKYIQGSQGRTFQVILGIALKIITVLLIS